MFEASRCFQIMGRPLSEASAETIAVVQARRLPAPPSRASRLNSKQIRFIGQNNYGLPDVTGRMDIPK